jgi:hypothetical protein
MDDATWLKALDGLKIPDRRADYANSELLITHSIWWLLDLKPRNIGLLRIAEDELHDGLIKTTLMIGSFVT